MTKLEFQSGRATTIASHASYLLIWLAASVIKNITCGTSPVNAWRRQTFFTAQWTVNPLDYFMLDVIAIRISISNFWGIS
jgi:hypothetical protein